MADRIGVTRNTVGRWETGVIVNVESENVKALVEKAGANPDEVSAALLGADHDDELVQYVLGADLSAADRREILDYIAERRGEEAAKLRRDIDLMLRKRQPST